MNFLRSILLLLAGCQSVMTPSEVWYAEKTTVTLVDASGETHPAAAIRYVELLRPPTTREVAAQFDPPTRIWTILLCDTQGEILSLPSVQNGERIYISAQEPTPRILKHHGVPVFSADTPGKVITDYPICPVRVRRFDAHNNPAEGVDIK